MGVGDGVGVGVTETTGLGVGVTDTTGVGVGETTKVGVGVTVGGVMGGVIGVNALEFIYWLVSTAPIVAGRVRSSAATIRSADLCFLSKKVQPAFKPCRRVLKGNSMVRASD